MVARLPYSQDFVATRQIEEKTRNVQKKTSSRWQNGVNGDGKHKRDDIKSDKTV
jgi:hypothetical protein